MRALKPLSLLISLPLLSGCAVVDSTIAVSHERPIALTQLTAARDVSVETVQVPFASGIQREGVKKNGWGHESASIFTDPKPDSIVQQALSSELKRAGFNVVGKGSANLVQVEIRQFFAEPEVGMWAGDVYAVVDATVSVTLPQSKVKRRFTGIGKVTTMVWADGSFRDAFQIALQDFLGKCVPELVKYFEAPPVAREAAGRM